MFARITRRTLYHAWSGWQPATPLGTHECLEFLVERIARDSIEDEVAIWSDSRLVAVVLPDGRVVRFQK